LLGALVLAPLADDAGAERPRASPVAPANPDRDGMVPVPAGPFVYGCGERPGGECVPGESPARTLALAGFSIDRTEVTVAQYRACVEAGACSAAGLELPFWPDEPKPEWAWACNWGRAGREQHPLNCVDWSQAAAYCRWAGKRLPTQEEWEKAARGTDARVHPWGDRGFTSGAAPVANVADETAKRSQPGWTIATGYDDGYYGTAPVASYPAGESPYGALDMAGNVWEWTSSAAGRGYVIRGGSWNDGPAYARASRVFWDFPAARYEDNGFRCAR
jgi:formylglycine-generating enzyme required for sulfatase activity